MGFSLRVQEVVLSGQVTIDLAPALRQLFLCLTHAENQEIILNAQAVEDIDLACLQLLYAATQTLKNSGRKIIIQHPSPAFVRSHTLSGAFLLLNDHSIHESVHPKEMKS